jgi:methylmalonyl-CoA mutase N-terminal domain/subunit
VIGVKQVQAIRRGGDRYPEGGKLHRAAAADRQELKRLRGERNQKDVDDALAALTRSAGEGNGNLLALAIDAARAKATVGEISDAMEKVFGRHRAEIKVHHRRLQAGGVQHG